ncbi:hypothetical protein, partial [Escherichia coli]|uniref:hypothetical protein n=1 Tax=Escherichia coli TaxID=562 RepID=UPI001BC8ACEB
LPIFLFEHFVQGDYYKLIPELIHGNNDLDNCKKISDLSDNCNCNTIISCSSSYCRKSFWLVANVR